MNIGSSVHRDHLSLFAPARAWSPEHCTLRAVRLLHQEEHKMPITLYGNMPLIHSSLLARSTFCTMKIDHISGLTLYPGYWLVYKSKIGTTQKLTLNAKRPYIRGPYKWARVYIGASSKVEFASEFR